MTLAVVLALAVLASLVPGVRATLSRRGVEVRLVHLMAGGLVALGALVWGAFALLGLDLEHHDVALGAIAALGTFVVALAVAFRVGRMPSRELVLAVLTAVLVLAAVLMARTTDHGLASTPVRVLLVAPPALLACGYFGISLGYLLAGGGHHLGYESLIGRRFLLAKTSAVLSTVTAISLLGVALGVAMVIVALGVLAGFENDLERKIIGANAHITVATPRAVPFALTDELGERIAATPGVVAQSPIVEGEVAVASSSNYTAGLLFGIDPRHAPKVLTLLNRLADGSLTPLEKELQGEAPRPVEEGEFPPPRPLPQAVLGVQMAQDLNVKVGDSIRVISPMLESLTPLGPAPKSIGLTVAAIFSSEMYEFDARYAFVSLPAARRFLELGDDEVTGVQLATRDLDRADLVADDLERRLGEAYVARDWKVQNQTLFSALKLERVVAFVVLVFIILVASFSVVNTLTMSVIEKKKEIAILKTMGARDSDVMKLFLVQGLTVGLLGTAIGVAIALVVVGALQRFGFSIPGDVYYIKSLPVHLEATDVVLVVLAALLIIWDFAVLPALKGSLLSPVEGLRDG